MRENFNKVIFSLVLVLLIGAGSLPAASSLRWIHLGTMDAGLVNLAIDGKIAYRKMSPGRGTPWGNISQGLHRFQMITEKNSNSIFELEIADGQRLTIVSVSDKNGDLQSRTLGLNNPESDLFVLNMLPGAMMSLPTTKTKAIFGKGFWLPNGQEKTTVTLVDSEGFSAEVDFSLLSDSPQGPYFAVLCSDEAGRPNLTILREKDSLFEMSDEPILIEDELAAGIRIISEGNVLAKSDFDPSQVKWDEVESQIFWLNLGIDRDPCRLEIKGFPAMRRMHSGRGSGFVKWPAGNWSADIVVERTNESLTRDNFSLSPEASIGLISSGGGKYPHRMITLAGRSREEGGESAKSQIRFVNALPDGILKAVVQYDPEPRTITLEAGKAGEILPLEKGGFPGASIDFKIGNAKSQKIGEIPPMPSMPQGDWVVVIHLDQESFTSPVMTWVEMDKGSITDTTASEDVE